MNHEFNSVPAPGAAASAHLTETQFGELLSAPGRCAGDSGLCQAEAHLLVCEACAAELAGLRESLSLFRDASTAYADEQLRRLPPMPVPARPLLAPALRPMVLAVAATLVLAAFLPMQMLHQRALRAAAAARTNSATSVQTFAAESNDALLEDVDRAASASVPDAMQALADPTAVAEISDQKSTQRKD